MEIRIYTIRDNKMMAYLQPFFERTDATALRAVEEATWDPKSNFSRHAEDYSLWSIGVFEDENGDIRTWPPMFVANLIDLKERKEVTAVPTQSGDEAAQMEFGEQPTNRSRGD